jgi:hypothetical protein
MYSIAVKPCWGLANLLQPRKLKENFRKDLQAALYIFSWGDVATILP